MRILLRWKILILAVLAPLALGIAALTLVDHRVSSNVRTTVNESLTRSALVSEQIMAARARALEASARVVSQDPRFLSVMALASASGARQARATMNDVARGLNHIAQVDLFEAFDPRGRLISSMGHDASVTAQREALFTRATADGVASGLMVRDGVVLQVTAVRADLGGRRVGTLLFGLRMGRRLAGELGALTRSEVTFVTGAGAGTATAHPIQTLVGGKKYLALQRPVPESEAGVPAFYVLRRSLDEEMAFLSGIQRELLELGFIILIAATALGIMVSLTITRPVSALVRAAEEMEKGNYDMPIEVNTEDEIGYLADRFREMRQHERGYVATLEEVARLKSDFISVASHELRTPATLIRAYGDLIADGNLGPVTDEQRRAIGVIQQSVNVIVRITDDATSMANVQGERPILHKDDFAAAILIREAVATAAAEGPQRKVAITESLDAELGIVRVDGTRIREAITHLVRNAIRFTPDGGSIEVSARRDGGELRIDVRDTGIGIPQEKQAHLFTRSFLLRDVKKHHSSSELEFNSAGLGLGLPIARGIAQAHGGSISVTSNVGEGSTFTIRIPAIGPNEALAAA